MWETFNKLSKKSKMLQTLVLIFCLLCGAGLKLNYKLILLPQNITLLANALNTYKKNLYPHFSN